MATIANMTMPSVRVTGNLQVDGAVDMPNFTADRSAITQDALKAYSIPMTSMRKTADLTAVLPTAGNATDLGLVSGTHGTNSPGLEGTAANNNIKTEKARFTFVLPPEYDAGETITIRARAGQKTGAVNVDNLIDFEAYKHDKEQGIGSDLVTTSAINANSTTLADVDFTVDPTSLNPGDILDVELTVVNDDTGGSTTSKAVVGDVAFLLDVRG